MDSTALIQLVREIDQLKREVNELKEQLQPVFKREAKLQREAELNKQYPCGWSYADESETDIISY